MLAPPWTALGLVLLAQQDPLVPSSLRVGLRGATTEIAKTGAVELVARMQRVLVGLGDDEHELERLVQSWEKTVLSVRAGAAKAPAAAAKLRREIAPLVARLASAPEGRRAELAGWILELDATEPAANAALGRERGDDGVWRTSEEARWQRGAESDATCLRQARELAPEIERGTGPNAALGGQAHVVRAAGLELDSLLAPETLARILGQTLRAAALSNGVLTDELAPSQKLRPHRFVLLAGAERLAPALEEARAHGGLSGEEEEAVRSLGLGSFLDARGWYTVGWRSEADFAAVVLWQISADWLGADAQPCLRSGHLNWLCLNLLGTSRPAAAWRAQPSAQPVDERSLAPRDEGFRRQVLWRCARQTLYGTRAWMIQEARAGRDPPWVRSMLDQEGRIRDEDLLKTTLVCELLQDEDRLAQILEATRGKPPTALPAALGEDLPAFEQRWKRWLLRVARTGVLQELERGAPAPEAAPALAAGLLALNHARADALKGQSPEIEQAVLDPELSRGAELHARYLALNPDQVTRWPEVHEEFATAPGFTVEGSRAGLRALIELESTPEKAVASFLGSFYHRLPLLDPGLVGVGLGVHEGTIVLDAGSLVLRPWREHVVVWPLPDAIGVPRAFVPERPSPVPGVDLAHLGYPISVQLFAQDPPGPVTLALELFAGDAGTGTKVEGYAITPDAPPVPSLAPPNAWGFVPSAQLAPHKRYSARAAYRGTETRWSFTTGD